MLILARSFFLAIILTTPSKADNFDDRILAFLHQTGAIEAAVNGLDESERSLKRTLTRQVKSYFKKKGKSVSRRQIKDFVNSYLPRVLKQMKANVPGLMVGEYRKIITSEELAAFENAQGGPALDSLARKMKRVTAAIGVAGKAAGKRIAVEVLTEMMQTHPIFK